MSGIRRAARLGRGSGTTPPALVEREEELARLGTLLDAAADGGRVLFVSGAAGTGKSTLLSAVRDEARPGVVVRCGRCDPTSTPAPFAPLYEMLPTLPEAVAEALHAGARRELVFSGLLEELRDTPSVLAVDDVHWADEATIDLLRYLGRRIGETRAALVCTYRDEEVDRSHPLQALLGELGPGAERMQLRALTVDGVARLADGTLLDPLKVYAASGGNPFFVTQMLAHPDVELPPTVEDAILARARTLSATAWTVLEAVGLSPDGIPLAVLERLSPTAELDADAAVGLGLLAVEGPRVRARHELIRLALDATVPPNRRRRLHRQLLDLLAETARTAADTATLAHHAVQAGDGPGIVRYALAAARRAAQDGAHREAVAHYAQVLGHDDLLEPDTLVAVLEGYYYECYLTGSMATAIDAARRALALCAEPTCRGHHLRWLSRLSWMADDPAQAEEYGLGAVAVLEEARADPRELAFAYSNLAQLAMLAGDRAASLRWGRRALDLAEAHGDVEVTVHALNNLGTVDAAQQHLLVRSLELAVAHGLEEHAARAYTNLGHLALFRRELDRAATVFAAGLEYTEARDLEPWWVAMLDGQCLLDLYRGRWADADRNVARTVSVAGATPLDAWARLTGAHLALRRGDVDAEAVTAGAIARLTAVGQTECTVSAAALDLERTWHTGEAPDADLLAAALELAREREDPWRSASLLYWLRRLGRDLPAVEPPPPVRAEIEADEQTAAQVWDQLGCDFEAVLLRALHGSAEARREATETLLDLGAAGTVRALRRHLAAKGVRDLPRGPSRATRGHPAGLTPRQVEVLALLVRGRGNAEIADALRIAPKTAEHHVSAILAKLDASTRAEAIAAAHDRGLV